MAGEAPTGRIKLRLAGRANAQSPYLIAIGEGRMYIAKFRRRPYEAELSSGGITIVFVLRLENSDKL